MAAGLVPLPLVFDMTAVAGIELHMIAALARAYSFPMPTAHMFAKVLISIAGGIVPAYLSMRFSASVRGLPLIGRVAYMGALSIGGGVAVYTVGKIFQEHFESGGTLLSSDNRTLRKLFKAKFKEGQSLVPLLGAPIHSTES